MLTFCFSRMPDSSIARANGTIRVSYDVASLGTKAGSSGSGDMAYSTLHALNDGTWGLLYETSGYKNIDFMRVDAAYLGLSDPGEGRRAYSAADAFGRSAARAHAGSDGGSRLRRPPVSRSTPAPQPTPDPEPTPAPDPAFHSSRTLGEHRRRLEVATEGRQLRGLAKRRHGDATYRFNADGIMVTGWDQQDGKWSHYTSYGARTNGWFEEAGHWYYFDPSTGVMKIWWAQIDGHWYNFGLDGRMVTGWKNLDGHWDHRFGTDGHMATGWQQIGLSWYYFGTDGQMKRLLRKRRIHST